VHAVPRLPRWHAAAAPPRSGEVPVS
jgi:hypothetical protein